MSNSRQKEQIKALRSRAARPERENAYWTIAECDLLRTMFVEGSGITEIALALLRTVRQNNCIQISHDYTCWCGHGLPLFA